MQIRIIVIPIKIKLLFLPLFLSTLYKIINLLNIGCVSRNSGTDNLFFHLGALISEETFRVLLSLTDIFIRL